MFSMTLCIFDMVRYINIFEDVTWMILGNSIEVEDVVDTQ